jgi:hypothetical protein
MSFMQKLRKLTTDHPPRILIYGPPKIGKTTLASEFPNPVFIQIEDGQNSSSKLDGWGRAEIQSYNDVMEAMRSLYEEEHDFKTLVVDSISELQTMVYEETCQRGDEKGNAKSRIEDFGYGKGYVNALNVWKDFLDALNMLRTGKGMTTILIGHAKVDRFDDPETVSYHRYEIDVQDSKSSSAMKLLEREMDAILLLKRDVTIKEEDAGPNKKRAHAEGVNRFIHCEGKPSQIAGSRLGLPAKIPYRIGHGYTALAPYLPAQPAPAAAPKAA